VQKHNQKDTAEDQYPNNPITRGHFEIAIFPAIIVRVSIIV
jgi:hypothetical protein